jgi:transposase-like protein
LVATFEVKNGVEKYKSQSEIAHLAEPARAAGVRKAPPALAEQVISQASAALLDRTAAHRLLLSWLHPSGPACPVCGLSVSAGRRRQWWAGGRVRCTGCGKWFTGYSASALHGAKLSARQIVLLALLAGLGAAPSEAARLAGINPETARIWLTRARELRP